MNEWWWLLFFTIVAGGCGWLLVKTRSRGHGKSTSGIPTEYLKGLDFLLDQQHDKATEVFIRLLEVDSDTVETHFVLGNLFRQKGEAERAIRIHRNITRLPGLGRYYEVKALLELGRDYFSAGLFDRAEEFFKQVLKADVGTIRLEAYRYLLSLYEIEKNWREAILVASKLRQNKADGYRERISHYYCELVEQALAGQQFPEARKFLAKARWHNRASLRVMVLSADIDLGRGKTTSAERQYVKAFGMYPQYAELLLPKIRKALGHLDAYGFSNYLGKLQPEIASTAYLLVLCRSLLDAGRVDEVEALFSALVMRQHIPLPVARLYLEHKRESGVFEGQLVDGIIGSLTASERSNYSYQCAECGFEAHRLYWQCPGCRIWGRACPRDQFVKSEDRAQSGKPP